MRVRKLLPLLPLLASLPACEPASLTAARDQLRRGPARTVALTLPLLADTFTIGEFLAGDSGSASASDTATTPSGIRAVRFAPDSLTVAVGDRLSFDGVTFDGYTFSYDQMLVTEQVATGLFLPGAAPGAAAGAAAMTDLTFDTPDGSSVDNAVVASGYVVRRLVNGTSCAATIMVTVTDAGSNPIVSFADAVIPAGDSLIDSVSAGGAAVSQFARVEPVADFGGCVPAVGAYVETEFTFRPLTLQSVTLTGVNETFSEDYAALASEARLQALDSVRVAAGSLSLTVENRLPVALTLDLTLQGITQGGVAEQRTFNVPAAPGGGATTSATLVIDLAGAVIQPGTVLAQVQGLAAAGSATISALEVTDAVTVAGGADIQVAELVGVLDPAVTPELNIAVENTQVIANDNVDFGDFSDAVRGATINEAVFTFGLTNTLGTPITLDAYTVGVAVTAPDGSPRRDGLGNILYETDAGGTPLTLTLANPGSTQLVVPSNGSASVEITTAAPLLDRLVHLLLDDSSVALVGVGTAVAGDGATRSRVLASDQLVINLDLLVGLDITLPDTGVVFTAHLARDGAGIDPADADEIVARLVTAEGLSVVQNGIPYGVEVTIALIEGVYPEDTDVFALPGHVTLATVAVEPATVDGATGRATTATTADVTQALTSADVRPLLGETVTATARIRILPPAGSSGRGAVVSGDPLVLTLRAVIRYQAGGSQ